MFINNNTSIKVRIASHIHTILRCHEFLHIPSYLKCICNEKLKKFFFEIWKEVGSIDLEKTFFVSKTALKVSKIP